MSDPKVQELRDRVASLKAKVEEERRHRQELRDAENQLAFLTASIYVVVAEDRRALVYGVSKEVKRTRVASAVSLSLEFSDTVKITSRFMEGSVSLYLTDGDRISFTVNDDELENSTAFYMRAFASLKQAQEWVDERNALRSHP